MEIEKMPRKEINSMVRHMMQDQVEYEEEITRLKEENAHYRETLEYIMKRGYTGAAYVASEAIKRVDESKK